MKTQSYKKVITIIAICFLGNIFAQKVDKKFTENFKVEKNVEVAINATNTEINVTTWNKNEVEVNAFIEIEGLSKKEAQKYIDKWNFEALGNKRKVSITSKGANFNESEDNFVFFNENTFNFPEIDVIDFDSLRFPVINFDFEMPDLDIIIPEMDFDIDSFIEGDGEYNIQFRNGGNKIIIKSKKEWEDFKKTKEYKELKKELKNNKEKFKKEWAVSKEKIKKINKEDLKRQLKKAKIEFQKVDKEEIKKQLAKATKELRNMKRNFFSDENEKELIINGKKIIIKKRLEIKVPKSATFDLNTRHCKVKLPNTVAYGKVSYGSFIAGNLNGGELSINYSPVAINQLNGSTLFLNNVTDAKIASVTNTKISNNSSGVVIGKVNSNTDISNKFGELEIVDISANYKNFNLLLDYTNTVINLSNISKKMSYDIGGKSSLFPNKASIKLNMSDLKKKNINGNFTIKTKDNSFIIKGKYSQLSIKE